MPPKKRTERKGRQSNSGSSRYYGGIPLGPAQNGMTYTTRWEYGILTSDSKGSISISDIAPSISNSSEYSTVSSLFTECKLLSCSLTITNCVDIATVGSPVRNGELLLCTQMQANQSVNTPPTGTSAVSNGAFLRLFAIGNTVEPFQYRMKVPRRLEYASITADAPNPVTPWAGSPGAVYAYAQDLTPFAGYCKVFVTCTYALRGRI